MKHKQAKKWDQAVICLRRLIHSNSFDEETRYELSICNLKLSPKELGRQIRQEDHALRGLQGLIRSTSFNLLDRLRKERLLDANDFYYVGFHFGEGRPQEKAFGEALLEHVAKKWPSTKAGKAARSKLKLVTPRKAKSAAPKTSGKKRPSKKATTPKATGKRTTKKKASKKSSKKKAGSRKSAARKTTGKKPAKKKVGKRRK